MRSPPRLLTIAGSDSGGGAGIQADLKTFSALGGFGMSVITAVTAQNTVGVSAVHEIPVDVVTAQLDAVVSDIGVDAAKTGMLANAELVRAVAERARAAPLPNLVVDPVMVAKGGDRLLREDAVGAVREALLPVAALVTPNLPEAEVLLERRIESRDDMRAAARALVALGARAAVVKGGHSRDRDVVDVLFDGETVHELSATRVATASTHGTGCTFASAIAAYLGHGLPLPVAVDRAKRYLWSAIQRAYPVGHGHGPVHHFWPCWSPGEINDGRQQGAGATEDRDRSDRASE
jgi:hydroxymethylpyrimidine/phosphomethylpyrimidine kinase